MTLDSGYDAIYGAWRADPVGWWEVAAAGIDWERRWDLAFDAGSGPYGRWLPGAVLNTSANCLDRHVDAGDGEQTAVIWDSPMAGVIEHLSYREIARPDREARRRAGGAGRGEGRSRHRLHAHGAGRGRRDVGLRTARRGALRRVWRVRRAGAGQAHRRRQAPGRHLGLVRPRTQPHRRVQAVVGPGDRDERRAPAIMPHPTAPDARGADVARAGPRPRGGDRSSRPPSSRPSGRGGSALRPLHVRHDGQAEGRRARQWRPCRGAAQLDRHGIRAEARRRDLDRIRRRLGRGPQLHRLRSASRRTHHGRLRGQAGRHARSRRVLAGVRAAPGQRAVHGADRAARHSAAGSGRTVRPRARPVEPTGALPPPGNAAIRRHPPGSADCSTVP